MMMQVKFTIDGEPKGKGRPRFSKGRVYTPEKTASYESLVALAYRNAAKGYKFTSPVLVKIYAFHKPPKSASKKVNTDMLCGLIRPTKKPDLDNIAKIVLDGLNKVAWDDDVQVVEMIVGKFYSTEPYVMVVVEELTARRC